MLVVHFEKGCQHVHGKSLPEAPGPQYLQNRSAMHQIFQEGGFVNVKPFSDELLKVCNAGFIIPGCQ
jgi:hypothetical protein